MAAVAGEAAWFGGAKRVAEPGCERRERRIRANVCSMSARPLELSCKRVGRFGQRARVLRFARTVTGPVVSFNELLGVRSRGDAHRTE